MVKKDLIKRHNDNLNKLFDLFSEKEYDIDEDIDEKNLEDEVVYDLNGISAHKGDFDEYYIDSVSKVFHAKKYMAKAYKEVFVEKYNDLIDKMNENLEFIADSDAKIKAFNKRYKDLKVVQSKLLEMCQKVYKPDNYDYCMNLDWRKREAEQKLNATKTYRVRREKQVKVESTHYEQYHTIHGGYYTVPYTTTHYKSEPYWDYESEPDEETREAGRQELNYIYQEIEKQQNFDYNMKLSELYYAYDDITYDLGERWSDMMGDVKYRKSRKTRDIEQEKKLLTKVKKILKDEQDLLKTINKFEDVKLKKIVEPKQQTIPEDMVCHEMGDGFCTDDTYSLHKWSKICNRFINEFNVDFVEKFDMSKIEKDYIYVNYYDDYFDYDLL